MTTTSTRNRRTATGTVYSAESVERALNHHTTEGNIRGWMRREDDGLYVVDFVGLSQQVLTLREALFMAYGLASAAYASKGPKAGEPA